MPFEIVRPELSLVEILFYAIIAFSLVLLLTPWFVRFLRNNNIGKQLRVETIDGKDPAVFRAYHQAKFGTPTMGGILIWGGIIATILLSRVFSLFDLVDNSLLQRGQVYLPLFTLISLGILGAFDDYLNIISTDDARVRRAVPAIKRLLVLGLVSLVLGLGYLWVTLGNFANITDTLTLRLGFPGSVIFSVAVLCVVIFLSFSGTFGGALISRMMSGQTRKKGLGFIQKIFSLLLLSILAALWFHLRLGYDTIHIPVLGDFFVGWWYVPIFVFILVGTANAVNFTDGLDGLAGGLLAIAFAAFGIIAYFQGLHVLAGFCGVCVGAIAAFLWHNVPPALFFMGDTGSLALGGTLAVIAMMIEEPLVLPLIGFIFVVEMLSVICQLTSKKFRGGKKIFLAAPIHHHFEALGWGESKVTMRLWIVGGIAALFGVILGTL